MHTVSVELARWHELALMEFAARRSHTKLKPVCLVSRKSIWSGLTHHPPRFQLLRHWQTPSLWTIVEYPFLERFSAYETGTGSQNQPRSCMVILVYHLYNKILSMISHLYNIFNTSSNSLESHVTPLP